MQRSFQWASREARSGKGDCWGPGRSGGRRENMGALRRWGGGRGGGAGGGGGGGGGCGGAGGGGRGCGSERREGATSRAERTAVESLLPARPAARREGDQTMRGSRMPPS